MIKLEVDTTLRSSGDGMETSDDAKHENKKHLNLHEVNVIRKEPKFVPYEPYRAAVTPIDFRKKDKQAKSNINSNTSSNGDKAKLAKHRSLSIPKLEIEDMQKLYSGCEHDENTQNLMENSALQAEIADLSQRLVGLKNEKKSFESQLDIQTQVNAELKKLLVASVGEDLCSKVQFLTEDKAHLAKSIVRYTDKVVKDSEQLEKLEVQCDIWRSKFLASRLMVDELACWKATLGYQLQDAHGALRCLLAEQQQLNCLVQSTYSSLQDMTKHLPYDCGSKPTGKEKKSLLNLAYRMKELAVIMLSYFSNKPCSDSANMEPLLPSKGEYHAQMVLAKPDPMTVNLTDHKDFSQNYHCTPMYPRFHPYNKFEHLTFYCCPHCKGEIVVV